jgi:predicted RNA-binding protein Jag
MDVPSWSSNSSKVFNLLQEWVFFNILRKMWLEIRLSPRINSNDSVRCAMDEKKVTAIVIDFGDAIDSLQWLTSIVL